MKHEKYEVPELLRKIVAWMCSHTRRPNELIEGNELIEKLSEAIGQLAEKERQTVILYYQQHLTIWYTK